MGQCVLRSPTRINGEDDFTVLITPHLTGHEIVGDVLLFDGDAHGRKWPRSPGWCSWYSIASSIILIKPLIESSWLNVEAYHIIGNSLMRATHPRSEERRVGKESRS